MDKLWTLTENSGLAERGHALITTAPLELQNANALTTGVLEMRQGLLDEVLTDSLLTGPLLWCGRHITNTGTEELWAASNNAGTAAIARRVAGTWTPVTFSNTAVAADLLYMQGVSLNGKFFLAYNSDVNRLHVWDGSALRRVGLIVATVPTAATQGGAGLSFTRSYRQRNTVQVSSVTTMRSEPSTIVTITISDDAGVTVTKGAVSGDSETHWELEASVLTTGPWYLIATTVVGTTTYSDTSATVSTTTPTDETGLYIPPPSAKYMETDGVSLLMGGAWETSAATGQTTPVQNRVWFTRPLGASDVSDDESIPDSATYKNRTDIGDAGPITAISGPIYGEMFVFKSQAVAKLIPTGDAVSPYALSMLTYSVGAVHQRLVTKGELDGIPVIFFADTNAAYALSAAGGISTISDGIGRDLRATTIASDPGLLLFDPFQRILLLQVTVTPPTPAGSYTSFTMDTSKKQWSGFTLGSASTVRKLNHGAISTTSGGVRRMYVCGQSSATVGVIASWGGQCVLDRTEAFTTLARFRRVFKLGYRSTVGAPTVWYRNPQGATSGTLTLAMTYTRDFDEARTQSKTLETTADENGIAVKQVTFEGLESADVSVLDLGLSLSYSGTAFGSEVSPTIDAVAVPYQEGEALAQ